MQVHDKHFEIFITEERIKLRISELAAEISNDYAQKDLLFISILNGAFIFAADLIRAVSLDVEISFIKIASYEATASTGSIKKLFGLNESIEGRHIIVVEDVVDTGLSMTEVLLELESLKPASLEIASLLFKPGALKKPLDLKYVGFEIPNDFVVGYGLDYAGKGRGLAQIYKLKE
jgi:hypoxanthine phosphoribosyltransferase